MKKLLGLALAVTLSTSVLAETFTVISPQKPGQGTSQWAYIIVNELQKQLPDDELDIRYYPGARGIPAPNDFQENLRFENTNILISNGGNGISYVLEPTAKYNYADWDSIGMMNLNIINAKLKNKTFPDDRVVFASRPGRVPDAMGIALLLCGPNKTVDQYIECFNDNVRFVKGMNGGEIRLAFRRGELTADRENPAAHKKHVEPNKDAEVWFHHGILQADGSHTDDPNYPGYQLEILFEKKWGVKPEGRFYNAYKLIKSYRDGLQKAIWVNKNNPNRDKLVAALKRMINDPESKKVIEKKVGNYEWVIGNDGNNRIDILKSFITPEALEDLNKFATESLDLNSVVKNDLLK